jgi:vacuolar protein sorting-associated protein 13A/C
LCFVAISFLHASIRSDVMSLGSNDDDGKMTYNEIFHLNPFKFNLSFLSHGRDDPDQTSATNGGRSNNRANLSSILLAIPEKLIPNVELAPIGLKGLLLSHSFATSSELYQRIAEHYKRQLLQELLKILGSFDALGSPVSLVQNLGTGVKDLFYEPAKGITISPKEFGKGLGKGSKSFIKKTVYGLFNSASKVVGTIGTGVAMMSFDDSYQRERAESKRREKPKNALFGLGYGLKEFGEGLVKGIGGIVYQPIKGAQEDGAAGFFKGIGQGLIGVVVKPTVGALDMVQRTTEGIKNTTSSADQNRKRRRPPRYIDRDRVLRIYDLEKAQMQSLLHQLEGGAYKKHKYSSHIYLENIAPPTPASPRPEAKHLRFFLISHKVIFFLARTKLDWRIWLEDLVEVRKEATTTKATMTLIYKKSDSLQESPDLGAKQVDVIPQQIESVVTMIKEQWQLYRNNFRSARDRPEATL